MRGLKFASIVLAVALVFIRKSDSFLNPQFWAEDATVFLKEAYLYGLQSLTIPYAGYYHTYPRLVALVSCLFPARYVPAFFNVAALGAFLLSAFYVYSPRVPLQQKGLLVLLLVVAPVGTEVFMNVTNAQWHLAIVLVLIVLSQDARSRWLQVSESSLTAVLALTGPFSAIFAPLFLWRLALRKSVYSLVLTGIVLAAAIFQAYAIEKAVGSAVSGASLSAHVTGLSNIVGYFIIGSFGKPPSASMLEWLWLLFASIATLVAFVATYRARSWESGVLLSAIILVLLAVVVKFRFELEQFTGVSNYVLSRYTYVPGVLWTWLWVQRSSFDKRLQWLVLAPVLGFFVFAGEDFRSHALPNLKWRKHSRCLQRREHCRIPVNPPPWVLDIDLRQK